MRQAPTNAAELQAQLAYYYDTIIGLNDLLNRMAVAAQASMTAAGLEEAQLQHQLELLREMQAIESSLMQATQAAIAGFR